MVHWPISLLLIWCAASVAAEDVSSSDAQEKAAWAIVARERPVLFTRIRQQLDNSDVAKDYPGLTVGLDKEQSPVLRFHTKTWQVYPVLMRGFGDELRAQEGPLDDGILVEFNAYPISALEQQVFHDIIEAPPEDVLFSGLNDINREPYWFTCVSGNKIPARSLKIVVILSYGFSTKRALVTAVYDAIKRALAGETLEPLDP